MPIGIEVTNAKLGSSDGRSGSDVCWYPGYQDVAICSSHRLTSALSYISFAKFIPPR